jgi:hypothetical protein
MMATTAMSPKAQSRFRLRRADFAHSGNPYVDAGWWPQSLDLGSEVQGLIGDAEQAGFHTRRVLYNLDDGWQLPPRRMSVDGVVIKLSGYHHQRSAMVTLLDAAGRERLEVLVVPPDTDASVAARALDIAGLDGDDTRGEDIMSAARGA